MGKRLAVATLVISLTGVATLQQLEGSRNTVYDDLGGVKTVCYGTTMFDKSRKFFTNAECTAYLNRDLQATSKQVRRHLRVPVTQEQFNALVLFTYNVGEGAYMRSTLLRYLNAGDCWMASAEFPRWSTVRGKPYLGLMHRRFTEQDMFGRGCLEW